MILVKMPKCQMQQVVCEHVIPLLWRKNDICVDMDGSVFENTGNTSFFIQMGCFCQNGSLQLLKKWIVHQ